MKNAFDFDHYQFEFQDSAKRYDSGAYNLAGILALGGSLETLMEIGVDMISSRLMSLTDMLVTGVRDKGYHVVSPRERGETSGIVAFVSDMHDPKKIRDHLQAEHRLVIAVRSGRLRASPHFYNTEREIRQLIDFLPKH
jgi:selenocysteine lyase/cysteine desulfurase